MITSKPAAERGAATALPVGSPSFPEPRADGPSTSPEALDRAVAELGARKAAWLDVDGRERIDLLDATLAGMSAVARDWVMACLEAKRAPVGSFGEGEEWMMLSAVPSLIRGLRYSLAAAREERPTPVTTTPRGVRLFPRSLAERLLLIGTTGEVLTAAVPRPPEARHGGRVALILGAGNVSGIPAIDVLNKLFVDDQVVILKMNPVNAYLGPFMEQAFRRLIQGGFVRIVYGGGGVGAYLCGHPAVDTVHLTGSDKTFDAIVFGPGDEGARRKAERRPLISKPITGELGCVSPVIVVPGPWSKGDIRRQAVQISTWLASNAGFNCMTPRVLIQHRSWSQRQDLLAAVGEVLSGTPTRAAYYPGARDRHAGFLAAHPDARLLGRDRADGHLPWTLVADVDAADTADPCFETEAFCSLMAETALDAPDTASFLGAAVRFANETLWGTLSAMLIVHPRTARDPVIGRALEAAIRDLRYGTVGVNIFTAYPWVLTATPWGAHPSGDIYDVQSGIGFVNNVDGPAWPEKTVFRAPFRRIDPATVVAKRTAEFGRKFADYAFEPTTGRFVSVMATALRS
ncbi:MAG: aldehyde dehydrogenase family protein [Candidatus Limnocylindrales bacterium]